MVLRGLFTRNTNFVGRQKLKSLNFSCPTDFSIIRHQICVIRPGLPDGLFSNQKSQFGKNFQGLRLENVDIFYGHLEYFIAIWDIL
jgi:hypothetical protein